MRAAIRPSIPAYRSRCRARAPMRTARSRVTAGGRSRDRQWFSLRTMRSLRLRRRRCRRNPRSDSGSPSRDNDGGTASGEITVLVRAVQSSGGGGGEAAAVHSAWSGSHCFRSRRCAVAAGRRRQNSEPPVVETDADPPGLRPVRRNLVTQPALEQHDVAGRGRHHDPRASRCDRVCLARRRRHETIEPRVFEFEARASLSACSRSTRR